MVFNSCKCLFVDQGPFQIMLPSEQFPESAHPSNRCREKLFRNCSSSDSSRRNGWMVLCFLRGGACTEILPGRFISDRACGAEAVSWGAVSSMPACVCASPPEQECTRACRASALPLPGAAPRSCKCRKREQRHKSSHLSRVWETQQSASSERSVRLTVQMLTCELLTW